MSIIQFRLITKLRQLVYKRVPLKTPKGWISHSHFFLYFSRLHLYNRFSDQKATYVDYIFLPLLVGVGKGTGEGDPLLNLNTYHNFLYCCIEDSSLRENIVLLFKEKGCFPFWDIWMNKNEWRMDEWMNSRILTYPFTFLEYMLKKISKVHVCLLCVYMHCYNQIPPAH